MSKKISKPDIQLLNCIVMSVIRHPDVVLTWICTSGRCLFADTWGYYLGNLWKCSSQNNIIDLTTYLETDMYKHAWEVSVLLCRFEDHNVLRIRADDQGHLLLQLPLHCCDQSLRFRVLRSQSVRVDGQLLGASKPQSAVLLWGMCW